MIRVTRQARIPSLRFSSARACGALILALGVSACGSGGPASPGLSFERLRCEQPVLELQQGEDRQRQGNITIVASVEMPACERFWRVRYETAQEGVGRTLLRSTRFDDGLTPYDRHEQEVFDIFGEDFDMVFRITNQSQRVFRGAGAVWQATVNTMTVDSQADGLLGLVVLPGQTGELRVSLPVSKEREGSVYSFFLYDVVLDRDDTGETTELGNYEWYYTVRYQTLEGPPAELNACRRRHGPQADLRPVIVRELGPDRCLNT